MILCWKKNGQMLNFLPVTSDLILINTLIVVNSVVIVGSFFIRNAPNDAIYR